MRAPSLLVPRALAAAGFACLTACGGGGDDADSAAPGWEAALSAGLAYLAETDATFGSDVAVLLQITSDVSGDPRARDVAAARRGDIDADDLERYGVLLDVPKPAFTPAALGDAQHNTGTPDPQMLPPSAAN